MSRIIPVIVLAALVMVLFGMAFRPGVSANQPRAEGTLSLITATPEEGFALALRLGRKAVMEMQPDAEFLRDQRPEYARDAESLIAASHVVAVHFRTIAAANNYWRK